LFFDPVSKEYDPGYNTCMLIYTIGYGSRSIRNFLDLLRRYRVELLVDTRSAPYSRFQPDFRKHALQAHVEGAGIRYLYLGEALGGRPTDPQCYLTGADGTRTVDPARVVARPNFITALDQLVAGCQQAVCQALMCAELRPQDCHRSRLLAPQLEARHVEVLHIDEWGELKTQQEVRGWFGNA
jgi:uncharacterized protein (DUF488 family)